MSELINAQIAIITNVLLYLTQMLSSTWYMSNAISNGYNFTMYCILMHYMWHHIGFWLSVLKIHSTKCMYRLQKHAICMASKICNKKKSLFSKRIIIITYHVAFWKTGFVLSSFLLQSYFIFYCKPNFSWPEFESGKDFFSCWVWVKGSD